MIFDKSQTPQAIDIPFNWVADYTDGTNYTEYDFKTRKANDFYKIEQDKIYRFGLIGDSMKFYFEMKDGHFHLHGKRLDVAYIDENGNTFNLTNNKTKKDLITYKQAYTIYNKNTVIQRTNIESVNFGYKTKYVKNDVELYFQPIVSFPSGESAYVEIKLTSSKELDGEIVFYISGKERERFKAHLRKDISGQMNWTVK